jgi:hypothetical protein
MERHVRAGQAALELERPDQAVALFRRALTRARERDDAGAIGDVGFNLAVAQLRSDQAAAALRTASDTEAELARRGSPPFPALPLIEAIALYRTGQPVAADAAAARVEAGTDAEASARAAFLRGLIADEQDDIAGLRRSLTRLADAREPEHQADAAELSARLALRGGDAARARADAERAAELRRDLLDYRSLARSLALAARAAAQEGETAAAADLYLRAGRSAAAQHDTVAARNWLNRAISLSRDPTLTRTARSALSAVDEQR